MKNNNNLTEAQKLILEDLSLKSLNLKTIRALHIRENFQEIYLASNEEIFEKLLKKWYFWATHSRLKPIIEAAYTIDCFKSIIYLLTADLDFAKINLHKILDKPVKFPSYNQKKQM